MTSVQVTTWFLQMTDPAQLAEAPEPDPELEIRQAELPSPELSRMLYTAVGSDWYWTDRRGWSWERWRAWLARPELETWVAWVRGTPAGFAELERQDDAVELVSFGLLPAFIGRGLGPRLLDFALRRAWSHGPQRVWVHTCSLDGPAALRTYEARGLEIYDERTHLQDLPGPLEPWPGAERPKP
jgi:GNAT superfamily N-acetyltransferase